MLDVLLKLLGIREDGAAGVVDVALRLRGIGQFPWIVLIAIVLGGGIVWLYRQAGEHVPPARKYVMAGLRTLLVVLVLAMLLQPFLRLTIEGSVRRSLLMLFDTSASMRIEDPRTEDADRKRWALAYGLMDPGKGLDQPFEDASGMRASSRIDMLKAVLRNERLDLLPQLRQDYDLRAYTFGDQLRDVVTADAASGGRSEKNPWIDALDAKAGSTAGGDALRNVLSRTRGQPIAGIFMAWDSANNSGGQPLAAAEMARQEGVPLYIYGIGVASPKDLIVANLFAPEVAFVDDEVPITVRVRGQGLAGQSATLKLQLGDKEQRREVTFPDEGEQVITFLVKPEESGELELKAGIDPRPDEIVKDNNELTQKLRVIDDKIKVLYVEQAPRWEFRYLQAMLLRDRRISAKFVLVEGDPAIAEGEGSPFLPALPSDEQALFKFDLIILGDVDPRGFTSSQAASIGKFVSEFGGGFMMIAGGRYSPQAYRGTEIEKMLPVEWEDERTVGRGNARGAPNDPVHVELTAAGRQNVMMRLSDVERESEKIWSELPPIYWTARVARAKPGADVLLVHPDKKLETRFGKMPIMAMQQYGVGQVMFVGTDNLWRWRKNVGDRYYSTLWGQIIQRLSLPHLLGGESKRTQLGMDRKSYSVGDRVGIYARLYTESYEPITETSVDGYYNLPGRSPGRMQLRALPDQPGMYRGEFIAPEPGTYRFQVATDEKTTLEIEVGEPRLEFAETAMNEKLLREMARISGGAFFREEDLHKLPESVTLKSEKVRSTMDVDLWSSPIYFLVILGVLTAEWILRKTSQLK